MRRIFDEAFMRLCQQCKGIDSKVIEDLWSTDFTYAQQSSAMFYFAESFPELVVYHAAKSLVHGDVHILCALKNQFDRIAVAGALRVWPAKALADAEKYMKARRVAAKDIAVVLSVMKDACHELTNPRGAHDGEKWWIVGGRANEWAIWESSSSAMILETRVAETFKTRLLTSDEMRRFKSGSKSICPT
jgi:hypothetical protein